MTMSRLLSLSLAPLTLALLAACGSDSSTGPQPSPGTGDITIVQGASLMTTTAFSPNPKTVSLADGGEVRWVNQDGGSVYGGGTATAHQIMSDDAAFDTSEPFSPGQSYTIVLGQAGTYHYHCNIHPNMVGTITVTP
jgi:plastocyanin